jgi:hypothetical protein
MKSAASQQRFFRVVLGLAMAGLIGAVVSLTSQKGQHGISIMLVLWFPILWCLWTAYAFSTSNDTRPQYSLTLLWILIDAGILVAMLGGWNSNPGLGKSQGTELVVYVMYCPVITPFGLALYWIDDLTSAALSLVKVRNFDINAGPAEALSIWLSFSLIAAVQSYFMATCFRVFNVWRKRRRQSMQNRAVG